MAFLATNTLKILKTITPLKIYIELGLFFTIHL